MIDESMDKEQMAQPPQPWEFRSKPTWQRLIIMLGGVTVNLILGFLIYMMILFVWGQEKLKPSDMPHGYAVAQEMKIFGFASGDIITHVNGQPLDNALDINRYLMVRDVQEVTIDRQWPNHCNQFTRHHRKLYVPKRSNATIHSTSGQQ